MGRGGGGGGGGRMRYRASKSGHAAEPQDELGRLRWRNASRFGALNAGCFYKSASSYCPTRLTDFFCVMWTEDQDDAPAAGGGVPGNGTLPSNRQEPDSQVLAQSQLTSADNAAAAVDLCSGDFVTDAIIEANLVLPLVLLVVGTLVNLLTGRIALSYCSRQLPVCYYLVALCAVDTALLYFRLLDLWLQSVFDIKLTLALLLMDESACQLLNMLYSCLSHFRAMLQIAMAVDARRLVVHPLRCVERYSAEWVKNGLILMCVILILLNGHHLWTLAVVKGNTIAGEQQQQQLDRAYHCGWGANWPATELFTTWIWPLADLLTADMLPLAATLWAVSSSCSHLCRASRQRRSAPVGQPTGVDRLSCHIIDVGLFRRVSRTLVTCSLAQAVLQLPGALHACAMYAKFLAASLAAQASGSRHLGQVYRRPGDDDWRLFAARLSLGLQPVVTAAVLAAGVPEFRRDAARLLLLPARWLSRRLLRLRQRRRQLRTRMAGQSEKTLLSVDIWQPHQQQFTAV